MAYEIIYVCNSINNKNVREGELEILRKVESQLCFEFGSDEMNIKKRFYNDLKTLNKDYDALVKFKKKLSKENYKKTLEEEIKETTEAMANVAKDFGISVEDFKSLEINETSDNTKVTKHKITKKRK